MPVYTPARVSALFTQLSASSSLLAVCISPRGPIIYTTFLAGVKPASRTGPCYTMVDAMTRPLESWCQDLCAPRHDSYYSRDQNPLGIRLPSISNLVNDNYHGQVTPSGLEGVVPNHPSYRDVCVYGAADVPIIGPEGHISTVDFPSRRPADMRTRLSPTNSLTTSDRSDDVLDHLYRHQFTQEQRPSPGPYPPSDLAPIHGPLSRQSPCVSTQPMGPSQGVQSQHSRPGPPSQTNSPIHRGPPVRIADLLSNEQSSTASEPPQANQKAPQRGSRSLATASTYRINIRQQPVAARSCGYGERDRRVIDPPPIIQMSIDDPDATEEEIRHRLTHSYSLMHCTIWNEGGDQDLSSMPEDYRTQRRLMGTVVSSPFAGNDENDEYGCFFCFPDLSCRTPGSFRLRFSFMVLDPSSMPGHRTPVVALVMSDVFTVYNAKDFPGMKASTPLTKRLKEQGCLISIKKGNDKTRPREESESEEDYDEDVNGQRRLKRARKS